MIKELRPGMVALDFGPTQMNIQVYGDDAGTDVAKEAAKYAASLVTELANFKMIAAKPQSEILTMDGLPVLVQKMIEAVRNSGDTTLTPMAAVAGTLSDMTADWLFTKGLPKVIVNNGGDIAIRLSGDQRAEVGIAPALGMRPTHVLHIRAADGIGGVTTSGSGGRSFTKGLATAATVLAKTASIADACATSIGNATFSPHPSIRMIRAEEVDPLTDIVGHWVVRDVGELPQETVQAALENGWRCAKDYRDKGLIRGCVIFIGQMGVMLPEGLATLLPHQNIEEG